MASEGWHAGILYRAADDPLANLLHLAWDRDLRRDTEASLGAGTRRYVWIAPRLPAEVMSNVIEACRPIARRRLLPSARPGAWSVESRKLAG